MISLKGHTNIIELILFTSACLLMMVNLQSTYPIGLGGGSDFDYTVFDVSTVLNRAVVAGTCFDSSMCSSDHVFA
jgi:hypothetical protein